MFKASNVISVTMPQLAFIINQHNYKEVLICGLRQSGRTCMTRLMADLLRHANPFWEAVAPEESEGMCSREASERLIVKQGNEQATIQTTAGIAVGGRTVRQADLMEAQLDCPPEQLRLMLHTPREFTGIKTGASFVFATINQVRYYSVVSFDGEGEIPCYTLHGTPGAYDADRIAGDLYASDNKDDVTVLLEIIHEGFRMRSQIAGFTHARTNPTDAPIQLIAEQLPQAYADYMLSKNTLVPEYQALMRHKPEPIHFTRTGPSRKEAHAFAALIADIAHVNVLQQPELDERYIIAGIKMTKVNDHGAYLRYIDRNNPDDEVMAQFISGENEEAVYRTAHWASMYLSVMFEVPRQLFGHDIVSIGSL